MGCASAKHVATVQNEEEAQKGKNYQNGDVFGDEYRIKPVEEVKYMKNGAEEEQKIAARNQENLEKSASSNVRLKTNKEIPGLVHQPRANMHISESQQEFFRMLDEKIEKVCHGFSSKEQASFNFKSAVTIRSDFGTQENKTCHCFHFFQIYLP
uniref:Chromosome 16 C1orf21 homolog n=1 Tax=Bos taurus TaxID=9913 RepID=A0A3Q1M5F3_BOVIN